MTTYGADTAHSSIITDHAFIPRNQSWTLCKVCGLAQASHRESSEMNLEITLEVEQRSANYTARGVDDATEFFRGVLRSCSENPGRTMTITITAARSMDAIVGGQNL